MASTTAVAAYLALFTVVGAVFLFANLLIGRFIRPKDPHEEKLQIYECGEPSIGSNFVRFDLRFYVVALVFIVFDAEVAFLFPAATVFGKQTQLADPGLTTVTTDAQGRLVYTPAAENLYRELGVATPTLSSPPGRPALRGVEATAAKVRAGAQRFVWHTFWAVLLFFTILFIGFAYEWKTGAFDWVRAVTREQGFRASPAPPSRAAEGEPAPVHVGPRSTTV